MAMFIPRKVFPSVDSLPRSYFLGHHKSGLEKMKTMLSYIDLVIECRDYRVPITSRNPLFEDSLSGRERLIVYTKRDLGNQKTRRDKIREDLILTWQRPTSVLFSDTKDRRSIGKILDFAREHAAARDSLTGSRMMVVGMPNVGKSSLLNALRALGVHKGKAAHTGAQPGITRKIGTTVKIIEGAENTEGVYLVDTPGVFIPYVPNDESMLKLALCGSVKDTIIPPIILADYLLYQLNKYDPMIYSEYSTPTNDVLDFIRSVASKTGRLQRGAIPNEEATALWMIQKWRTGHFGKFLLDEVTQDSLDRDFNEGQVSTGSFNQALKAEKDARRQRARGRVTDAAGT